HDVFGGNETWYATGDILRRDADGDYWYVDRTSHLIRGPHGWISPRQIEDALYEVARIELAVVYGIDRDTLPDALGDVVGLASAPDVVVATLVVRDPDCFDLAPV